MLTITHGIDIAYADCITNVHERVAAIPSGGHQRPLDLLMDPHSFCQLDDPTNLDTMIAACRKLAQQVDVPAGAQNAAADWIAHTIRETERALPWHGKEKLLAAQRQVQKLFQDAVWWCSGRNVKTFGLEDTQDTGLETTVQASPPYTAHFNTILDFDVFRNLDNPYFYECAFRACQALARMEVPDETISKIKDWVRTLLLHSLKLHDRGKLLDDQMQLQKTLWLALWKCECDYIYVKTCGYIEARRKLGEGVWSPYVVDISVKRYFTAEDGVIEAYCHAKPKKAEDHEDEDSGVAANDADPISGVQQPRGFRLGAAPTMMQGVSLALAKFCDDTNEVLAQHPRLAAKMRARFKGCTSGDRAGVLKVHSQRTTSMKQVRDYLNKITKGIPSAFVEEEEECGDLVEDCDDDKSDIEIGDDLAVDAGPEVAREAEYDDDQVTEGVEYGSLLGREDGQEAWGAGQDRLGDLDCKVSSDDLVVVDEEDDGEMEWVKVESTTASGSMEQDDKTRGEIACLAVCSQSARLGWCAAGGKAVGGEH